MKKAIVTGATGAVGTALVNKLISKGVETLVLVRKGGRVNKIPSNPLVKIAYCSLDEMADFQNENDEKYDAFFHLGQALTVRIGTICSCNLIILKTSLKRLSLQKDLAAMFS